MFTFGDVGGDDAEISEQFRAKFRKWTTENMDTAMALSFLKSKLQLESSNIKLISAQQNGAFQYNIGTSQVKIACRLDGLAWHSERSHEIETCDPAQNTVVLGVELCTENLSGRKTQSGQIIVELFCLNIVSTRPALLLCTDLREMYTILYLTCTKTEDGDEFKLRILQKMPANLAFRFVSLWLNKEPDQFPDSIKNACRMVKECNK